MSFSSLITAGFLDEGSGEEHAVPGAGRFTGLMSNALLISGAVQ